MSHNLENPSPYEIPYHESLTGSFTHRRNLAPAPRILQEGTSPSSSGPKLTHQPSRKRQRTISSRTDATYPRKRAITACRLCRSRKVKCNNARPTCGNCEASGASCVFEDPQDFSTFDPASILILDRLNQVLTRLDQVSTTITSTRDAEQARSLEGISPSTFTAQQTIQDLSSSNAACCQSEENELDLDYQPEQLRIPTSRTSPDAVLQWPIFNRRFPPSYITDAAYTHEVDMDLQSGDRASQASRRSHVAKARCLSIDEESIIGLVERFLELVHIKNPILDVDMLRSYAQNVVEDGLRWDSASCLVLLACALGCIATRYSDAQDQSCSSTSLSSQQQDLQEGHTYYNVARKRFGLLELGILASQCHFLAGIYEMYTMRPIIAWSHFQSATKTYHLHLQCEARREVHPEAGVSKSSKSRSLEQRLYWSCYKTECELRTEIDCPNSSLADVHYADLHPSPPVLEVDDVDADPESPSQGRTTRSQNIPRTAVASQQQQEQTWFYYLTEITLRRIANRVLNLLYVGDVDSWTESALLFKIEAVEQFEEQLDECCTGLPPLIQFDNDHVPEEELPYLIRCRVLEIKTWMYTPFLYYAVHSPSGVPLQDRMQNFAEKGVSLGILRLKEEPKRHRHHGTWYNLRNLFTISLCTLAAVRSGKVAVPERWRENVETVIRGMRYWEIEGPGILRAIQVLESYLQED